MISFTSPSRDVGTPGHNLGDSVQIHRRTKCITFLYILHTTVRSWITHYTKFEYANSPNRDLPCQNIRCVLGRFRTKNPVRYIYI